MNYVYRECIVTKLHLHFYGYEYMSIHEYVCL